MNILLVEHNRGLLFSLHRYLVSKGHNVEDAFDGVIAINNFNDSFDLLIIDGDTPRVPCLEIIKLVKNKKKDIKVVVLMNDLILHEDILVSNEYVDEFIPRPFSPEDLDNVLNYLFIRKRATLILTGKEYQLLEKLREKEVVPYLEVVELIYGSEETARTYIKTLNQKLKGEEIVLIEKGFKLEKKYDRKA